MAAANGSRKARLKLEDVEVVSSYNCTGENSRTIIVPGIPPKWLGRKDTPELSPDCGARLLDYNAGNWQEAPMEPGMRAVLHLRPQFDFTKVDIIADRRQLALVLELAVSRRRQINKAETGAAVRSGEFHFGAQYIGHTVVFFRTDRDSIALPETNKFRGFADEFKKTYLEYPEGGLKESKSHHRIVTARLGDLRILFRHAADGYVPDDSPTLNEALANEQPVGEAVQEFADIKIKSGGALIPRSAVLELNTYPKDKKSTDRLDVKARECWLSQSAHFVVAKYKKTPKSRFKAKHGQFTDLRGIFDQNDINFYDDLNEDTAWWAGENGEVIQEFHDILADLVKRIKSAKESGDGETFVVEYAGKGMHIIISLDKSVRGLSAELSERVALTIEEHGP